MKSGNCVVLNGEAVTDCSILEWIIRFILTFAYIKKDISFIR